MASMSTRSGTRAPDRTWSIAEIADEFGVTHRTCPTTRTSGWSPRAPRHRAASTTRGDRTRLALVLRGKRLGFPLEEIRTIVDMYDQQPGDAGQLRYLLDQIDDRRADLEQRRRDVDAALAELTEFERRCRSDLDRLA